MAQLTEKHINQLLEIIDTVANADNPWTEKLQMIKSGWSDKDEINMQEFVGWFIDSGDANG